MNNGKKQPSVTTSQPFSSNVVVIEQINEKLDRLIERRKTPTGTPVVAAPPKPQTA